MFAPGKRPSSQSARTPSTPEQATAPIFLNSLGKVTEAEKVLREAASLRAENLPKDHFMSALTNGALGECLTTQKRFAEAEPLLSESYQSLKLSQGEQNPRTLLAKNRLDRLYQAKG
jgi:Tetratricopeptide repeat